MAARAAILAAAALLALGACFGDSDEVQPCSTADDCATPFLCCTGGTAVDAEGGPHCVIPDPTLSFCSTYLPHLVEGNPCERVPVDPGAATVGAGIDPVPVAVDQCREGLVCCGATLTCTKPGDCDGAAPEGASSGASCHADGECSGAQICCGISYYDREGACASVSACAASRATTATSSTGSGTP